MGLLSLLGLGAAAPAAQAATSTPYTQGGDPMAYLTQGLQQAAQGMPGYNPAPPMAAPAPQTHAYTQGGDPMAYLTQGLPGYTPPTATAPSDPTLTPTSAPDDGSGVTNVAKVPVTASKKQLPGSGYNNQEELEALRANQAASDPQLAQNPVANFMAQHGTLRSLLGTLGDAFLVQSGHQPGYQLANDRLKIARAGAGFDIDPTGAAARIAATGATGAQADAEAMYNTAQTAALHRDQQQFNQTYKTQDEDRKQQLADATVAQKDYKTAADAKSRIGAILGMAANSKDPKKWDAAIAQAKELGGKYIKDFKPDIELPGSMEEFNTGYGMTGNNVQRDLQRDRIANQVDRTKRAGIDAGIHNTDTRANATNSAYWQDLTDKETAAANGSGPPLTDGQKLDLAKFRHTAGGHAGATPPGLVVTPPGGAPSGGTPPRPVNQQDIAYLAANRNNPAIIAQFEARFGKGSSRKYLPR